MPVATQTTSTPRRPAPAINLSDPAVAWAPYAPSTERPWNLAQAAHLLRRAGFGPTWDELQQALAAGPQATVGTLLRPRADIASFNKAYDRNEVVAVGSGSAEALRPWWLRRMIETPHPLLEKMTLFWHDYFAISAAQVPDGALMQRHVQLLRTNALGNFPTLLAEIARDPATLMSLGATPNRKVQPNEHFARQLLDRYTVGPSAHTAGDVREAARAFTGQVVLRSRLRHIDREHDNGAKTVLGQTGNFDGEQVARITARHPATAATIVRRLYRWLVSEIDQPHDALLAPLTASFAKDFDVAPLVETMLRSNLFFSPATNRRRIRRPVEFALAIVRGLEATVPTLPLAKQLADLGEDLYYPPTTSGWAAGRHWINRATLVGRTNLATALLGNSGPYEKKFDPAAVAQRHGHADARNAGRFLVDLFLQPAADNAIADRLLEHAPAEGDVSHRMRQFADIVVTLPEFHLG